MKKDNPSLSIITPTYNRGNLLRNCYESLKVQSSYDFEWIVVDDGSKDNTKEIIGKIIEENTLFPLKYIWKENGGKHTALNEAHSYIHGKYVLILDSDDRLTEDAVETVVSEWKKYENNLKIGVVIFLRQNKYFQFLAYAKDEKIPVDLLSYKRTCVLSNDCCEVLRSDIFKKFPFPIYEGEKFLAETALWNRLAQIYKGIYINKAVYMCEYLEGGLTHSGRQMRIKNPKGGMYTSYLRMYKRCPLKERIKAGLLYVCYGFFAGKSIYSMIKEAKPYEIVVGICMVPGKLLHILWKKKYAKDEKR